MDQNPDFPAARPNQLRPALAVFALLTALLGAGYFFFLRTDYAVLYSGLREADASAIVAELDRRGVAYRLGDGGTTILVASDSTASTRLAIAGSDVPTKGAVGFELFNESDMGLTDFAQRINYQRALQGELARTIMMMTGVEAARVHLALPERSLFRNARAEPRAAVTVSPRGGGAVDADRVAGIQRLVAAAVPDLAVANVVVLDEVGRVISPARSAEAALPPDVEEQEAVRQYFRARARAAVERVLPDLRFEVRVGAPAEAGGPDTEAWAETAAPAAQAGGGSRNFRLRLVFVTEAPLDPADRETVRDAIAAAVQLDLRAGDSLAFAIAPLGSAGAAPPRAGLLPADLPAARAPPAGAPPLAGPWWWLLLAALAVPGGLLLMRSRRGLAAGERDEVVERIRRQLRLAEESGSA